MLYEATLNCEEAPATLIAGRLEPLNFDVVAGRRRQDIEAARKAVAEGKEPSERVIDHVVEKLLKELTW